MKDHNLFLFKQLNSLKNLTTVDAQIDATLKHRDCYYNKKGSQL
nr:hypothetical protein [uncultured Psychroserpens sp.]